MTHVCIYNNGSINNCYGKENIPFIKQKVFERAEKVAKEINLPLLKLESNFQNVVPQNHLRTHTYMDALAIYSLQKLWRVWYRGSGYYSFGNFSLENVKKVYGKVLKGKKELIQKNIEAYKFGLEYALEGEKN